MDDRVSVLVVNHPSLRVGLDVVGDELVVDKSERNPRVGGQFVRRVQAGIFAYGRA